MIGFEKKKYLNKRLYFLVDYHSEKILLVSFASKKEQQNVIDFVKNNKEELLSGEWLQDDGSGIQYDI